MAKKPLLLVVAGAIFDNNNRVLLAKRPIGSMMAGLWEFPGGKIEPEETPEQALKRELFEELNIIVEEKDLKPLSFTSYEYDKFHLLMPLFSCKTWEGTPIPKEKQELLFVAVKDINKFDMPPADLVLLKAFKNL
ncbi:MAG: (deoxy)nucleoside triphosphate pyrophosphohydrolase [Alphaproteobacteria bacterium]